MMKLCTTPSMSATLPYCEGQRGRRQRQHPPVLPALCDTVGAMLRRPHPQGQDRVLLETFKIQSGSGAMIFKTFEGVGDIFSKFLNVWVGRGGGGATGSAMFSVTSAR